jgi:transposase
MLNDFTPVQKIDLAAAPTDMRKSIDGLAALVQQSFELDPFSPCLFVFTNRQRDKVKILQWEVSGFWVHYKRLERGRFQWPENAHDKTVAIDPRQLRWLLDGLSLSQRQAHKKVSVRAVI